MSADSDTHSEMEYTSSTLKLLQQYDNMTMERDKDLDYIEKGDNTLHRNGHGPSYDELFKENVKLRLKLSEYEAEISGLKSVIEELKHASSEAVVLKHHKTTLQTPSDVKISLPPRSADRMKNSKNLTLHDDGSEQLNLPRSPATFQLNKSDLQNELKMQTDEIKNSTELTATSENNYETSLLSRTSSDILGSPATSVSYTTSRISINSSQSPKVQPSSQLRKSDSPTSQKNLLRSPQRVNRVTHLINNELHSPLKEEFSDFDEHADDDTNCTQLSDNHQNLTLDSIPLFDKKSPRVKALAMEKDISFSPSSKQKLNTFTEMLNRTFAESTTLQEDTNNAFESSSFDSSTYPDSKLLASPVKFQNSKNISSQFTSTNKNLEIPSSSLLKASLPENISTRSITTSISKPSLRSFSSSSRIPPPTHQTSYTESESTHSAKSVAHTPLVSDIPLFVQPADFPTVAVSAISTLYINVDDPGKNILFSVVDKSSRKEMFKFAKSFDQILELDSMFKTRLMESYNLPTLPKRQMFQSTIPVKVDLRRELICNYFDEVFQASQSVPLSGLKLAQFISTDTVIDIPSDDTCKEGILLLRKNKTIGSSTSWKVRYAVIENQLLLLYDQGNLIETIKISTSTIELQANLPDDKYGTKNGFIINEPKKVGLSACNKHFLGAETAKQREEWISALMQICNNNTSSMNKEISSAYDQTSSSDISFDTSFNGTIGPMVNLESHSKSLTVEPSTGSELDKETKRNRMRSFFPFKKAHAHASGSNVDLHEVGDDGPEGTILKPLKNINLNESLPQTIFGSDVKTSISIHSNFYNGNYEIPTVVYRCLEFLYKKGAVDEEGIFRLSGSSALIKSLQEQFEKNLDINLCEYNNQENRTGSLLDVNTVTGLLKLYFRSLPHLIFGDLMYDDFRTAAESSAQKPDEVALKFRELVHSEKMQKENYSLMYVLFELLVKINDNNKVNKMNLRNLCIVFSPTLNIPVNILQPFITDFRCIFQGKSPLNNEERQCVDVYIPQISK